MVEKGVMRQYGVSQNQAHQMIESNDPRANKVWDGIVQQNVGNLVHQVRSGRSHVESHAGQDANNFHNEHQGKVHDASVQNIKTQAANQGLDKENIQGGVANQKHNLQTRYNDTTGENSVQYQSVSHANKVLNQSLQQRADKYEEDRTGQGDFAKGLGNAVNLVTANQAGSNIGGPHSAERAKLNSGANASQLAPVVINKDKGGNHGE